MLAEEKATKQTVPSVKQTAGQLPLYFWELHLLSRQQPHIIITH